MEPRFFNHGDRAKLSMLHGAEATRFNGATVFQPWRQPADAFAGVQSLLGFNGATVFQPWRQAIGGALAEGSEAVSMEPRFFNHGDANPIVVEIIEARRCFNGATVFQPWRQPFSTTPNADKSMPVSMEPRFFNHGDLALHRVGTDAHVVQVSMEPRFFNHGDLVWHSAGTLSSH